MRIVVIGAPGAGKGTQAKLLAERFDTPHVSTGDLLRAEAESKEPLGIAIKVIMDAGLLVPDAIVIDLVRDIIDTKRFIFDGFPRTLKQAQVLDAILAARGAPLYRVVYVKIDDEIIVKRMAGRRSCRNCGTIYHLENKPPKCVDSCDICGGKLIIRDDDSEPVVRQRLVNYYELTAPIIDYYRKQGLVFEISGLGSIDDITNAIVRNLQ